MRLAEQAGDAVASGNGVSTNAEFFMNATMTSNASLSREPKLGVADWIALILMIVGSINWGLVGAFHFNLVSAVLGDQTLAARIVYGLVGLAGLYGLSIPARLRPRA